MKQDVEGYVIKGDDIIAILKKNTGVKIQIRHSLIEGGLDFTTLPRTPVDAVQLPPDWSDTQREKWTVQHSFLPGIPVVANEISIVDTEIRPEPQHIVAVEAMGTFFSGTANFASATFRGAGANFAKATFRAAG